jgi:hypothetical protein
MYTAAPLNGEAYTAHGVVPPLGTYLQRGQARGCSLTSASIKHAEHIFGSRVVIRSFWVARLGTRRMQYYKRIRSGSIWPAYLGHDLSSCSTIFGYRGGAFRRMYIQLQRDDLGRRTHCIDQHAFKCNTTLTSTSLDAYARSNLVHHVSMRSHHHILKFQLRSYSSRSPTGPSPSPSHSGLTSSQSALQSHPPALIPNSQ